MSATINSTFAGACKLCPHMHGRVQALFWKKLYLKRKKDLVSSQLLLINTYTLIM